MTWSLGGPCLEIMGPDKVAIIAGAAKVQLRILTLFSKRGVFLALDDGDFPIPYLTGQMPSSSPRVVQQLRPVCHGVLGRTRVPCFRPSSPLSRRRGWWFFPMSAGWLGGSWGYETLISRVHS